MKEAVQCNAVHPEGLFSSLMAALCSEPLSTRRASNVLGNSVRTVQGIYLDN